MFQMFFQRFATNRPMKARKTSFISDAEHPTIIPMYTRAYSIGPKVNPLLNASPFHSCETWLLPNARTLHMPRYQGDPLGDARNDGQVPKYKDEGARREEPEKGYRTRTSGQTPDIRPLPQARTSGPSPEIRRPSQNAPEAEPRQPGHPARDPDIRLFVSRRTSGPQPGHPALMRT